MNWKAKGTNAERELISFFWKTEKWAAIRAAGSGCSRFPSPDILAGNSLRRLSIECKTCQNDKIYILKKDIEQLENFSRMFGAEAWIGIRFSKKEWYFLSLEDVKETHKNFTISTDLAKRKGLLFEEMLGNFE
ncbi:MAG: Holliday junction resolvase Hjc [Candidatus Woesearchaeota archaeon]